MCNLSMYNKYHPNKNWEMLISTLRTSVNNSFYESFDITFMGNEKNCQNINCFFFFSHNFFFNWIVDQYPKDTH